MKKICYIVSGIDTALAFQWIHEHLDKTKFKLHFVLLHTRVGGLEEYLKKEKVPHTRIPYASKEDIPVAIVKTTLYLRKHKISLVHCHLLDAGLVGIPAAKIAGVPSRIYTRHYSTYHHSYYQKGVWYDKTINSLSTKIIAVSEVVKEVLVKKERVKPEKIAVIHHGFPLEKFKELNEGAVSWLRLKYTLQDKYPVIGVIARQTKWKGIQYIIPAFKRILEEYPNAYLVLANATGDYQKKISALLQQLPAHSYAEIAFEEDLFSFYHCFDLFVHTPINYHAEAFGQVYIEAMAAGIPSVFTLSGIAGELVRDQENALVAEYADSDSIYKNLKTLLENADLRKKLGLNAQKSVTKKFELDYMMAKLMKMYE